MLDIPSIRRYAESLISRNRPDRAEEVLRKAIEHGPTLDGRADYLALCARYIDLVEDPVTQSISDPKLLACYTHMRKHLFSIGATRAANMYATGRVPNMNIVDACKSLEQYLTLDKHPRVYSVLADLYFQRGRRADAHMALANGFYSGGSHRFAAECGLELVEDHIGAGEYASARTILDDIHYRCATNLYDPVCLKSITNEAMEYERQLSRLERK